MYQKIFYYLIILLSVFAQVSFFPMLSFFGTIPDLVLIIIIIWTIQEGFEKNVWRVVVAGLLLDLLSFWPIGLGTIAMLAVSFVTDSLVKRFLVSVRNWRLFLVLIIVSFGTALNFFGIFVLGRTYYYFFSHGTMSFYLNFDFYTVIIKIAYNLVVFLVVYWPMRKMENFLSMYNQSVLAQGRFFKR